MRTLTAAVFAVVLAAAVSASLASGRPAAGERASAAPPRTLRGTVTWVKQGKASKRNWSAEIMQRQVADVTLELSELVEGDHASYKVSAGSIQITISGRSHTSFGAGHSEDCEESGAGTLRLQPGADALTYFLPGSSLAGHYQLGLGAPGSIPHKVVCTSKAGSYTDTAELAGLSVEGRSSNPSLLRGTETHKIPNGDIPVTETLTWSLSGQARACAPKLKRIQSGAVRIYRGKGPMKRGEVPTKEKGYVGEGDTLGEGKTYELVPIGDERWSPFRQQGANAVWAGAPLNVTFEYPDGSTFHVGSDVPKEFTVKAGHCADPSTRPLDLKLPRAMRGPPRKLILDADGKGYHLDTDVHLEQNPSPTEVVLGGRGTRYQALFAPATGTTSFVVRLLEGSADVTLRHGQRIVDKVLVKRGQCVRGRSGGSPELGKPYPCPALKVPG